MRRVASDPGGHKPSDCTWRNCVVDATGYCATDATRGADAREQKTVRIPFARFRTSTIVRAPEQIERLARDPRIPVLREGESSTLRSAASQAIALCTSTRGSSWRRISLSTAAPTGSHSA
jgi:hypothetical protein